MGTVPTLSQLKAWDVDHLSAVAEYWTGTADRWESAFAAMHQQAHAVAWEGAGATAMRECVTADKAHVMDKADQLREVASIARRGASDISAAQSKVIYAVEDAQNAGFRVGEDLSVTDRRISQNAGQRAARRAQAQAFAAEIGSRVAALSALDNEVGANITKAADGIGIPAFGRVQAVDNQVCNDPDYNGGIERRFGGAVLGGAMLGGLAGVPEGGVGAIPGAIVGGASAGILDLIHEAQGDGPKCQ